MGKESAGLLVYRVRAGELEFLLVHPGDPFWKNKDAGAWTIPKGEVQEGEAPIAAAKREFQEELNLRVEGNPVELTPVKQKAGKLVRAWAMEKDFDLSQFESNTFEMEWPPRSGQITSFPEVDKAAYFPMTEAKVKINAAQIALLDELARIARRA